MSTNKLPLKFKFYTLLFVFRLCSCSEINKQEKRECELRLYPVTKVIDGDTFWIDDGSEKGKKVRLIGIDCPETRRTRKKEVGYYGKEAKEYVKKRLDGQSVRLVFDVDQTDHYGRLLAYVYLEDGTFLNAELMELGYAEVMTIQPNSLYADEFVALQREARENKRGMWGQPVLE